MSVLLRRRLVALLSLVLAALPACSDDESVVSTLMQQVDRSRYLKDLEFISQVRNPGSSHHEAVRKLCISRFKELGYTVTEQVYDASGKGGNVLGKLVGQLEPQREVFVSAHYDHIKGCEGADDNGSGAAAVLESARVLAAHGPYRRTLVVACWDEEEVGLVGSAAYVSQAKARGDTVDGSFVYEMIGYKQTGAETQTIPDEFKKMFVEASAAIAQNQNRGDFIAVVYNEDAGGQAPRSATEMLRLAKEVGLTAYGLNFSAAFKISAMALGLMRSDHFPFVNAGYPAMMITDTANYRNPNYHCAKGKDVVSTLDHDFSVQVIKTTVGAVVGVLQGG